MLYYQKQLSSENLVKENNPVVTEKQGFASRQNPKTVPHFGFNGLSEISNQYIHNYIFNPICLKSVQLLTRILLGQMKPAVARSNEIDTQNESII